MTIFWTGWRHESDLLGFISKNLSWGVFKDAFQEQADEDDFPFFQEYLNLLDQSDVLV